MTINELKEKFKKAGFACELYAFGSKVSPPYIVLLQTGTTTLYANGVPVQSADEIDIEVYITKTDISTVEQIKALLIENHLDYEITNWDYLSEHKLVKIVFFCCLE